jgi:hypothetical protein
MSYFHTGTRTIIGAEAFHCPVRDGKEWDHLAMVIRLNRSPRCKFAKQPIRRVATRIATGENQNFDCTPNPSKDRHNAYTYIDSQVKVIGSSLTSN